MACLLYTSRGDSTLELTLTPQRDGQSGDYRIGAWVRDSTAGVGTLSFYGVLEEGGDCLLYTSAAFLLAAFLTAAGRQVSAGFLGLTGRASCAATS